MRQDHDIITDRRSLRLSAEHPGRTICGICPPWGGENSRLRRNPRKRTDRHKNHRRTTGKRKNHEHLPWDVLFLCLDPLCGVRPPLHIKWG